MFRLQKKQIGLCGILLTLLTLFSFSATPVSAQSTGQWVDKGTISFGGKTYTDGNTSDSSYTFQEQGGSTACVSTSHGVNRLVANGNPYTGAGTQFEFVKVTVQPTEPPCSSSRSTVAITATENRTKEATGGAGAGTTENPEGAICITENGLGWIICPLTDLLSKTTTLVADLVEGMLRVDPLPLNPGAATDGSSGIYQVWSGVRNIANIVLVFGFFAIIFSQATSVGISSYGIKKLLPRLVIVSIAINLSYFICALMIDIFNILGAGVAGFFSAANATLPLPEGGETKTGLGSVAAASLATFAVAAGAAFTLGWAIILPALAVAATAFLTAFIVLVFREVAIVILVILSPLAFAAWLLPNTDSYFSKWKGLFTNLLIMYPLVMIIIYGSILTSSIIQTTSSAQDGTVDRIATDIMALLVLALPLFSLPFLLKFAGGIGQRIGAFANNPNRGLVDRARKKRDEVKGRNYYQRSKAARKSEREEGRKRQFAQDMSAPGKVGKLRRRAYGGLRITDAQQEASKEAQANIYDAYRENLSKTTERRRGRLTDAGAFTAGSEYEMQNADGSFSKVDKDKFMKDVYINQSKGRVISEDGNVTDVDGSDRFTRSAIAAQAAKSGDKAMFGKLLTAAQELQEPVYKKDAKGQLVLDSSGNRVVERQRNQDEINQGKALEFVIRDQGISNPSGVIGGHPDVIKGQYSAFKAVSVDVLSQMDGSAVKRMSDYLNTSGAVENDMRLGITQKMKAENPNVSQVDIDKAVEAKAESYRVNSRNALKQAVEMINNNPNLEGKVPANGDLAGALRDNFANDPHFKPEEVKIEYVRQKSAAQAPVAGAAGGTPTPGVAPTVTIPTAATGGRTFDQTTDGGLHIPHDTPTPQPSAPQSAPQPAPQPRPTAPTPPPFTVRQTPTTGQPSATDTTVPPVERPPRRRDDGGNFGGFA